MLLNPNERMTDCEMSAQANKHFGYCKKCGGLIRWDKSIVLTSSPTKYKGECSDCSNIVFAPCYMVDGPNRDWLEDRHLENGNYTNICHNCRALFVGYKRRPLCKQCGSGT